MQRKRKGERRHTRCYKASLYVIKILKIARARKRTNRKELRNSKEIQIKEQNERNINTTIADKSRTTYESRTPLFELPEFNGNYKIWPRFKLAFVENF